MANILLCTYHIFQKSILCCFHVLALVNNASWNNRVHTSPGDSGFINFRQELLDPTRALFLIFASIVFFIMAVTIYVLTNRYKVFLFSTAMLALIISYYLLLSLIFLIIAILVGVRRDLIAVLICTPLTGSDAEHLFVNLLVICLSLEKWLFRSIMVFSQIIQESYGLVCFCFLFLFCC